LQVNLFEKRELVALLLGAPLDQNLLDTGQMVLI